MNANEYEAEINRLSQEIQRLQRIEKAAEFFSHDINRLKFEKNGYRALMGKVLEQLETGIPRQHIISEIATFFVDPNAQPLPLGISA